MMKLFAALILAYVQFLSCQAKGSAHMLRGTGQTDCTCVPASDFIQAVADKVADSLDSSGSPAPQCGPGSWKKLWSLDMRNPSNQCPSGWQQYSSPARSCGRPHGSGAGCNLVSVPAGTTYSKVCGRAVGRAVGSPDAFDQYGARSAENYVDGISITHSSPRQHIWTFAGSDPIGKYNCPCNGFIYSSTSYVGGNYFCDGSQNGALWDGNCVADVTCCSLNSPPWFTRQLPSPTSSNVDVRICTDEHVNNENIRVEVIELYVQ